MADPSVYAQLRPLPQQPSPLEVAGQVATLKNIIDTTQDQVRQRQLAEEERKLLQTAWTEAQGDPRRAIDIVARSGRGDLAQKMTESWATAQGKLADLEIKRSDQDLKELELVQSGLGQVKDQASFARFVGLMRRRQSPIVQDVLASLGDAYDPATVQQFSEFGMKVADVTARRRLAWEMAKEKPETAKKWQTAIANDLSATAGPEDWAQRMGLWKMAGAPEEVIASFGEWSPEQRQQAEQRAMTARERASVANDADARDISRGQLDVARGNLAARQKEIATGGAATSLSPAMESNVLNRLTTQWTAANKPARDLERQVSLMDAGMNAARRGDMAPGAQAVLVTFQKILDPTSVVRESEYARSASGLSLDAQVRGAFERLSQGGAGVPLAELEKFYRLAKEAATAQRGQYLDEVKARLGRTADRYKIPRDLVFEGTTAIPEVESSTQGAAPAVAVTVTRGPDGKLTATRGQ